MNEYLGPLNPLVCVISHLISSALSSLQNRLFSVLLFSFCSLHLLQTVFDRHLDILLLLAQLTFIRFFGRIFHLRPPLLIKAQLLSTAFYIALVLPTNSFKTYNRFHRNSTIFTLS